MSAGMGPVQPLALCLQAIVYTRQPSTQEGGGDEDGILWNTQSGKGGKVCLRLCSNPTGFELSVL